MAICSYESKLFSEWKFGAGVLHGPKLGPWNPLHAQEGKKGGICIFTTRFPREEEEKRRIIGLFKIGDILQTEDEETWWIADKKYSLRLPLSVARKMYFWNYYSNRRGGPRWCTGLYRYLDDSQVISILKDLYELLTDEKADERDLQVVEELLSGMDSSLNMEDELQKRRILRRKYGSGGEGESHKKLKEWLSCKENLSKIGIKTSSIKEIHTEYVFESEDAADILIKTKEEDILIEIKTKDTSKKGFYQLIKYKALRCAQKNISLNSGNVRCVLVSLESYSDIDVFIDRFCKRYGIEVYKAARDTDNEGFIIKRIIKQ